MKPMRQDTARTRESLLTAASEVFAAKGYRDATIAEISERAGTNIAAVNYHFGGKEALYRDAWRHSFQTSIKAYPPDGGVDSKAPVEERLAGRVLALLRRITDNSNKEFLIAHKELANPTGLLKEVMVEEMAPLRQRTMGLVRELLGPESSERQIRFATVSIVSQCIMPTLINMADKAVTGDEHQSLRIDDVEAFAEHVVAFSLAGMQVMQPGKRQNEHKVPAKKRLE